MFYYVTGVPAVYRVLVPGDVPDSELLSGHTSGRYARFDCTLNNGAPGVFAGCLGVDYPAVGSSDYRCRIAWATSQIPGVDSVGKCGLAV